MLVIRALEAADMICGVEQRVCIERLIKSYKASLSVSKGFDGKVIRIWKRVHDIWNFLQEFMSSFICIAYLQFLRLHTCTLYTLFVAGRPEP